MLTDIGWYLWSLRNCEGGDPTLIRMAARIAGIRHALIKIQDDVYPYNQAVGEADPDTTIKAVISALEAEGITVWGWDYVNGEKPGKETERTIERVKALGLKGFVIDAEVEYKNRSSQAVMYTNAVRYRRVDGTMVKFLR